MWWYSTVGLCDDTVGVSAGTSGGCGCSMKRYGCTVGLCGSRAKECGC